MQSGGPYDYYGVPQSIYEGLLRALSRHILQRLYPRSILVEPLRDAKKRNVFSRALARTREAKICVSIDVAFPRRSGKKSGLDFFLPPAYPSSMG